MEWKSINELDPQTEHGPLSLIVQHADGSDQRIIPDCFFKPGLGGLVREASDPVAVYFLSDNGEYATHWGEGIGMPPPEPPLS